MADPRLLAKRKGDWNVKASVETVATGTWLLLLVSSGKWLCKQPKTVVQ